MLLSPFLWKQTTVLTVAVLALAAYGTGARADAGRLGRDAAPASTARQRDPHPRLREATRNSPGPARPGSQLWIRRYNPDHNDSRASAVAVSPDGRRVFVAGNSATSSYEAATVAYGATSGKQLWASRYHGFATGVASATAVTVSPDSRTVYVTGWAEEGVDYLDYLTVAYNVATGRELWAELYDGSGSGEDNAYAIAVSPLGNEVFVTGMSLGIGNEDYATVAYNTATGAQLWVSRYNGPANGADVAGAVAVSPSGNEVFVTGTSDGTATGRPDFATVAYDAVT
jgi:hypothetical protein